MHIKFIFISGLEDSDPHSAIDIGVEHEDEVTFLIINSYVKGTLHDDIFMTLGFFGPPSYLDFLMPKKRPRTTSIS